MEEKFITASEERKVDIRNVSGIAYSGGKLALGWDFPVVIELSGMSIADQIPLMLNHMNRPDCRLGVVTASNSGKELSFTGGIDMSAPEADMIMSGLQAYDWQVSVGANVLESHLIEADKAETVNGREFTGPLYVVGKSELREISVVAIGADAETHMRIAAALNMNPQKNKTINTPQEAKAMEEIKKTPDVDVQAIRKAEIARIAEVNACFANYPGLREKAIQSGWTAEHCKEIAATLSAMPPAAPNVIVDQKPNNQKTIEAALMMTCGESPESLVKSCGEKAVEAAMKDYKGFGIRDVVMLEAKNHGYTGMSMCDSAIRAAFSSVTLPGLLSNVANKRLLKGYKDQEIVATKLCTDADLADFKESDRYRLEDGGNLEIVADGGEIKNGTLLEESAKNQLDTYGKSLCLTRKMIINDDLGAFLKIPEKLGRKAARKVDELFFTRLLSNPTFTDGVALFQGSTHKNLLTGSSSALSKSSLELGIAAFADQTDGSGLPVGIDPKYLLVPTGLFFSANELINGNTLIMSGGDETQVRTSYNSISNLGLQVIKSPYLANSKISGYSNTAWYLFADPAVADTFEIGYLRGRRAPTIEQGETDYNTLGIWFRVYFDIGVREQDYRTMLKANGKA